MTCDLRNAKNWRWPGSRMTGCDAAKGSFQVLIGSFSLSIRLAPNALQNALPDLGCELGSAVWDQRTSHGAGKYWAWDLGQGNEVNHLGEVIHYSENRGVSIRQQKTKVTVNHSVKPGHLGKGRGLRGPEGGWWEALLQAHTRQTADWLVHQKCWWRKWRVRWAPGWQVNLDECYCDQWERAPGFPRTHVDTPASQNHSVKSSQLPASYFLSAGERCQDQKAQACSSCVAIRLC